jgi:hypothetical protein
MSPGTHYLRPDSVHNICREPRMARGPAFVGNFLHILRQARLGPVGRASTWLDMSVPRYPRPVCVEEHLFAAIARRTPQGWGIGVRNEAGWTHRT